MEAAVKRFHILALIVGVFLIMLTIGVIVQVSGGGDTLVSIFGPTHGIFYMAYVVLGYDVWRRAHWPLIKMIDIVTAGFIPGRTFFVERRIIRQAREAAAAQQVEAVQAA